MHSISVILELRWSRSHLSKSPLVDNLVPLALTSHLHVMICSGVAPQVR